MVIGRTYEAREYRIRVRKIHGETQRWYSALGQFGQDVSHGRPTREFKFLGRKGLGGGSLGS